MQNESRGKGVGALWSLIAQNNTVNLRFKVHDLSASRKTNEIYGGLTIAYRFMEDIDKN